MPVIRGALQVLIGRALSVGVAALVFGMLAPASACGRTSDCQVGDRTYRISKPEGVVAGERIGALVFMHGWRSNPANVMANGDLVAFAHARGLALIAPKSAQDGWDIAGSPSERQRSELPFFDALLADVGQRHGIDTGRLIASGFSAGGMMVWNLICHRGDSFTAFIPISGTYWRPVPRTCATPGAPVVHIHGRDDPVVPMTGRKIRQWQQGDVQVALSRYRRQSAVSTDAPVRVTRDGLSCDVARFAGASGGIGMCTHAGGHWYTVEQLAVAFSVLRQSGVNVPEQQRP
ncbi:MAG: polyhydroxybutyrate depolymerase [Pseudomonadota bacterium]